MACTGQLLVVCVCTTGASRGDTTSGAVCLAGKSCACNVVFGVKTCCCMVYGDRTTGSKLCSGAGITFCRGKSTTCQAGRCPPTAAVVATGLGCGKTGSFVTIGAVTTSTVSKGLTSAPVLSSSCGMNNIRSVSQLCSRGLSGIICGVRSEGTTGSGQSITCETLTGAEVVQEPLSNPFVQSPDWSPRGAALWRRAGNNLKGPVKQPHRPHLPDHPSAELFMVA